MKTFIVQLARLGDICLMREPLKALEKKFPEQEIHLIVRPRFREAVNLLNLQRVTVHELPSDGLAQIVERSLDVKSVFSLLESWFLTLGMSSEDRLVNLTFSPISESLTGWLALKSNIESVSGPYRNGHGGLQIQDHVSRYFYAQKGPKGGNRYHIVDIYAGILGVEIQTARLQDHRQHHGQGSTVGIHVGASEMEKTIPPEVLLKWVNWFLEENRIDRLELYGCTRDHSVAEWVGQKSSDPERVLNLAGKFDLLQSLERLKGLSFLICPDSLLTHLGSIANLPMLQISPKNWVHFWETGPRSDFSFVLEVPDTRSLNAVEKKFLLDLVVSHSSNSRVGLGCRLYRYRQSLGTYIPVGFESPDFSSKLCQAIYLGKPAPTESGFSEQAWVQISESLALLIDNLVAIKAGRAHSQTLNSIDICEKALDRISDLNLEFRPLISWIRVERSLMSGLNEAQVIEHTLQIYQSAASLMSEILSPSPQSEARG